MKRQAGKKEKIEDYKIKLSEETIFTGPGTVPTSDASVARTSIKEMVSLLRKASQKGIFEPRKTDRYGSFQDLAK